MAPAAPEPRALLLPRRSEHQFPSSFAVARSFVLPSARGTTRRARGRGRASRGCPPRASTRAAAASSGARGHSPRAPGVATRRCDGASASATHPASPNPHSRSCSLVSARLLRSARASAAPPCSPTSTVLQPQPLQRQPRRGERRRERLGPSSRRRCARGRGRRVPQRRRVPARWAAPSSFALFHLGARAGAASRPTHRPTAPGLTPRRRRRRRRREPVAPRWVYGGPPARMSSIAPRMRVRWREQLERIASITAARYAFPLEPTQRGARSRALVVAQRTRVLREPALAHRLFQIGLVGEGSAAATSPPI